MTLTAEQTRHLAECECGDGRCGWHCPCGRPYARYGLRYVQDQIAHQDLTCATLGFLAAPLYAAVRWEPRCNRCVTAQGTAVCLACGDEGVGDEPPAVPA